MFAGVKSFAFSVVVCTRGILWHFFFTLAVNCPIRRTSPLQLARAELLLRLDAFRRKSVTVSRNVEQACAAVDIMHFLAAIRF